MPGIANRNAGHFASTPPVPLPMPYNAPQTAFASPFLGNLPLPPPLAPLTRPRSPLQGVLAAAPIAQLGKPRGCKTGIKLEHIFPVMNYQGVAEKVHTIGNRVYIFTGFLAGYILPRQRDCYLLRQGRWRCMGQGDRGRPCSAGFPLPHIPR